jgi:PAS domain S-box-containing protein
VGKSSLITRILLTSLVLVVSITGFFTLLIVSGEFTKEREAVDAEIERIVATFRPIAARAAYELDQSLAQQVVDSILSANYVVGAKIVDELNQSLASKAKYFEVDPGFVLEWALEDHEKTFQFPLVLTDPFDPDQIKRYGELEISVNLLAAMEDFASRNRDLFYLALALVLVFSVALVTTFELLLSRPLRKIVSQLSRSDASEMVQIEPRPGGDELSILVKAINNGIEKERQKAAELAESEARMNHILEGAGDACFLFDASSAGILYANRPAAELLNYSVAELLTNTAFDIVEGLSADEWRLRLEFAEQLPSHLREASFIASDGSKVPVENNTTLIQVDGQERLLIFARDLTSRKRLEENFAHAQRLGALGELTGGVAHDFNNALQVLRGSFEVLAKAEASPIEAEAQRAIESALGQAGALIKQLLAFSRKQILETTQVELVQFIQSAVPLFEQAVGPHRLELELSEIPLWVNIDVNALNNALVNLLVNARHAMESPGAIKIKLASAESSMVLRHFTIQERQKNYVCLSVTDSGTGIKPEDLNRIFEPYFTTKGVEKGTGLGLSMVYGFVSQVGGKIEVDSTLGVGTTFYLYLLREDADLPASPPDMLSSDSMTNESVRVSKQDQTPDRGAAETDQPVILLVDDNDDVRFISKTYLQSAGFSVVECRDGQDAVQTLKADAQRFSAMITDMIMPGEIGGKALIEHAGQIAPWLPIGVVSGYSDELLEMNAAGKPVLLLSKPFSKQQMVDFAKGLTS